MVTKRRPPAASDSGGAAPSAPTAPPPPGPSSPTSPRVVCLTCGRSPIDGAALFADGKDDDGRRKLYCAWDLRLDPARRLLAGRLLDADVAEALERRLGGE
jgi:hypothetical protein